jgi:hypothetical protein
MSEIFKTIFISRTIWRLHDTLQIHRVDGPAIEWVDGIKEWYQYDQLHRVEGPAIEWPNGDKEYYYWDKLID